jgi:hypothetical protein
MIAPTNENSRLINQQFSMNVLTSCVGANDGIHLGSRESAQLRNGINADRSEARARHNGRKQRCDARQEHQLVCVRQGNGKATRSYRGIERTAVNSMLQITQALGQHGRQFERPRRRNDTATLLGDEPVANEDSKSRERVAHGGGRHMQSTRRSRNAPFGEDRIENSQ